MINKQKRLRLISLVSKYGEMNKSLDEIYFSLNEAKEKLDKMSFLFGEICMTIKIDDIDDKVLTKGDKKHGTEKTKSKR